MTAQRRAPSVWPIYAALVLATLLGIAAFWYFTTYDTAAGKCERGDLGACTVLAAQQAQAASQRAAAERGPALAELSAAPECEWAVDGHDALAVGTGAACSFPFGSDWVSIQGGSEAPASRFVVCTLTDYGSALQVLDTGGAAYGGDVCRRAKVAGWTP